MAERPVSSTCSSQVRQAHKCKSHKDTAHQPEQPAPMERMLCGVFLGALLVVPACPVRRSSGEQEQALGLEMVWQSLHPTCQSRCAQTETERERGRERQTGTERQRQRRRLSQRQTGRQVSRWPGGGRQSAKSGVRRTPMQPFMEKACQARLLEEAACLTKGRKAKCHIGCFGETNANLRVAFPQFPRTGAMPEQIGEFPFPVGPRK